jgi:hypothetical protein
MVAPQARSQIRPPNCGALMLETPLSAGYRMPAEWMQHECCWMAWPSREDQWVDGLAGAQSAYAAIAQAIRRFEPVRMVAEPHCAEDARTQCGANIDIVSVPIDDPWMRDSGPTFLTSGNGAHAGTAWRFNAWGGKMPDYAENARLARRVLNIADAPTYQSSLCLEGGAIHTDGEGTVITTESVVLNANRNPGITKQAAERELCEALGATKVIWLRRSYRWLDNFRKARCRHFRKQSKRHWRGVAACRGQSTCTGNGSRCFRASLTDHLNRRCKRISNASRHVLPIVCKLLHCQWRHRDASLWHSW